jgi:hypothetical protein
MIKEEKVYFTNSKGEKLCGVFSGPIYFERLIVLCHGFLTSKDSSTNLELTRLLNRANIATFRFDFYGHGESSGTTSQITPTEAVDNLENAIKFVYENFSFAELGVCGSSFGGFISIIVASRDERIRRLALKSPVFNYYDALEILFGKEGLRRWKEMGFIIFEDASGGAFRVGYDFYEDLKNFDTSKLSEKIKASTLIVHGTNDQLIPLPQSKNLYQHLRSEKRLEVVEGADHHYSDPSHWSLMVQLISDWLTR